MNTQRSLHIRREWQCPAQPEGVLFFFTLLLDDLQAMIAGIERVPSLLLALGT